MVTSTQKLSRDHDIKKPMTQDEAATKRGGEKTGDAENKETKSSEQNKPVKIDSRSDPSSLRLTKHQIESATSNRAASSPNYGPLLSLSDKSQRARLHISWEGIGDEISDEAMNEVNITRSYEFEVWSAHYSPRTHSVSAEVVRTDPEKAVTPIRNVNIVRDRIALIMRGGAPLRTKILHAQRAGAVGVMIYDNTRKCNKKFDQRCSPGGDKSKGSGFAAQDTPDSWSEITIPSVLIREVDGRRILGLMA